MIAEMYSQDGAYLGSAELTEEVRMRAWQQGWTELEKGDGKVKYMVKEAAHADGGKDR